MWEFAQIVHPWLKAVHVVAVISWMAALLYAPRLFVYHRESVSAGGATDKLFRLMERRLLTIIAMPAMIATWISGLFLVTISGSVDWESAWPWVKFAAVLAMTWFHHWVGRTRRDLEAGRCTASGRSLRLMNEMPALLVVIIVVMVIVRPF